VCDQPAIHARVPYVSYAGLLLVLARNRIERWSYLRPDPRALPGQVLALRLTRALPMLTALAVTGIGAWIAIRSLMTI
jgi:hypothetical protein